LVLFTGPGLALIAQPLMIGAGAYVLYHEAPYAALRFASPVVIHMLLHDASQPALAAFIKLNYYL
jgi:hypothetical protein